MAGTEEVERNRRAGKEDPSRAGPRSSQHPPTEDHLRTFSSLYNVSIDSADRLLYSPSTVRRLQRENRRVDLEYYLRPLRKINLPGKEALIGHVQEKHRKNFKPNTLVHTVTAGKLFLGFLAQRGKEDLKTLSRQDIEAWVEREQDRGLKPQSVRSRLMNVYAFVAFLVREGVLGPELLERKIRIKLPVALPRAMAPEDVQRLLAAITPVRNRAMILVLLRTGMRIGELLDTKVRDVHLVARKIDIPQAQKTGVGRVVYLSDDAREALKAWLRERQAHTEYLFYAMGRETMCYGNARWIFKKYLSKAGLQNRGYTLHCLRHTFASEMLNVGMRLECLQALLGHAKIEQTRHYAQLTDLTREESYFRAMEHIERGGGIHGHYQLDSELETFLEEKKLLD
jgi:integrase/recombinase XerD